MEKLNYDKISKEVFAEHKEAKRAYVTTDGAIFLDTNKNEAHIHQTQLNGREGKGKLEELINPKFADEIKESAETDDKLKALEVKEQSIKDREDAVAKRESDASAKESDLTALESKLADDKADLDTKESELAQREDELNKRLAAFEKELKDLEALKTTDNKSKSTKTK